MREPGGNVAVTGAVTWLAAVACAGLVVTIAAVLGGCSVAPDREPRPVPRRDSCPAGTTKCCYVDKCYCYPNAPCMTCQAVTLPLIPSGTWRQCDPAQCEVCVDGTCQSTCSHCETCWRGACQDACGPHCQVCGFDATLGREACISTCTGCQQCVGGSCQDRCKKDKCQACGLNAATGKPECISTCSSGQRCKDGKCVSEEATYCPCDRKNYPSEAQCAVLCPSGIRCFGSRCQVPPDHP